MQFLARHGASPFMPWLLASPASLGILVRLFSGRMCCDLCGSWQRMAMQLASELRNVDEKTASSIRWSLTLISKALIRTIVEAMLWWCLTMLNHVKPSCLKSSSTGPVQFRTRTRKQSDWHRSVPQHNFVLLSAAIKIYQPSIVHSPSTLLGKYCCGDMHLAPGNNHIHMLSDPQDCPRCSFMTT